MAAVNPPQVQYPANTWVATDSITDITGQEWRRNKFCTRPVTWIDVVVIVLLSAGIFALYSALWGVVHP